MSNGIPGELDALQKWFVAECNGDWEHQYGVRISTLDNPGWAVDIDLRDTSLEHLSFDGVSVDRSEHDWIRCNVEAAVFRGRGGPENLGEILRTFLGWAEGK
jgi:hypothetical protein